MENKENVKIEEIKLEYKGIPLKVVERYGVILVYHGSHFIETSSDIMDMINFRKEIEEQIRCFLKDPSTQIYLKYDENLKV